MERDKIRLTHSDIRKMVTEAVSLFFERRNSGYWDYDNCYNEAKKYTSKSEFFNNNGTAYNVARKNGWLKDYTWFIEKQKPNGYWTYETCYNEAKKYKSKSEFYKKCSNAYETARKNGWLSDYTWFKRPEPVNKKWNYETCYNEAQKYKSCAEFERNNSSAYNVARVNGWIKDYTWFEKRKISDKNIYTVYCYKDEDTNAVYVGLTMDMKRRHREHKFGRMSHGEIKHDTVYKYFNSIGKDIPEPIILHKDIHAKDAQKYENEYVEKFKKEGNLVLNLAKTGSLGGYGKWNYQTCYEEAQKYKSRWEFRKGSCGAYDAARKNGWLDNYTWFEQKIKPAGYWDYENCYNEAKKYKSIWDFQKNSKSAFDSAKKHDWLKDYTWIERIKKPVGYWNYENCYNEAKKYKSSSEFCKGNQTAYIAARKNKWIGDYTWFKRPAPVNKKWNRETCYEEAKKYNSKKEFYKNNASAYGVASKNGWLDDYTWFTHPSTQP